jgi:hypothetical protein
MRLHAVLGLVFLGGCSALSDVTLPRSLGERNSGYAYIPLDPLPVSSQPARSCSPRGYRFREVLDALPDNAVRIAVGSFDQSGKLTYGPAQIGTQGNSYQVILDYINVDVAQMFFRISRTVASTGQPISVWDESTEDTRYRVTRLPLLEPLEVAASGHLAAVPDPAGLAGDTREVTVNVPVYVGVGLRLTASLSVLRGNVNLSSLGAIAAEAQAGRVSGSLVVQTLGISGRQVATSLPLPSELNSTTVQNAILSLGSIKAILYNTDGTVTISPRVTGIYNPFGQSSPALINAIVSELARAPTEWRRPCLEAPRGSAGR